MTLVYVKRNGIEEKGHLPVRVDEGVDHSKYNSEWLEKVNDGYQSRLNA